MHIKERTNEGFILLKHDDKFKYDIRERSDIIGRGKIGMHDTIALVNVHSTVVVSFEILGDFAATVTFRTIKQLTSANLTASSLIHHPVKSVIAPGVRVTDIDYDDRVAWVTRITIRLDT